MKDFLGNELEVGDYVAITLPGEQELARGVIRAFIEPYYSMVLFKYPWGGSHDGNREIGLKSKQLVKIT